MIAKTFNQVELKKVKRNITGRGGLGWMEAALRHIGIYEQIDRLKPRRGKSNNELPMSEKLMSEVLSRIDGASAIEDIEVLRADEGLRRMRGRKVVSADTIRGVLNDKETGACQKAVNRWLCIEAMKKSALAEFTYDNDATYFESAKESASWSYRESRDYSGLLGFLAELKLCATVDFRTGRISPRTGIQEQIEEIIAMAKEAGKRIGRVRLDSAGHNGDIFKLCCKHDILFYITLAQNEAIAEIIGNIRASDWQALSGDSDREYAEGVYVQNDGATARMIVLRWPKKQGDLFEGRYSYHVIGTSDNESTAKEVVEIHNGRMGSENYNKELKNGYNCDWAPSHSLTLNAHYFYAGVLAHNCVEFVKRYFIQEEEVMRYRIKKLRHWFIKMTGKLVKTGRKYYFHLINAPDKSYEMMRAVWNRLQYSW